MSSSWKGSPKATKVQRVGVAIFGLWYLVIAGGTAYVAVELQSTVLGILAAFVLVVGVKVTFNAFRKQKIRLKDRHPHRIPADPQ
jgi:hypothetical protein